jgi:hypothetical protein
MNGATQLKTWKLYSLQYAATSSFEVCIPITRKAKATMSRTSVMRAIMFQNEKACHTVTKRRILKSYMCPLSMDLGKNDVDVP